MGHIWWSVLILHRKLVKELAKIEVQWVEKGELINIQDFKANSWVWNKSTFHSILLFSILFHCFGYLKKKRKKDRTEFLLKLSEITLLKLSSIKSLASVVKRSFYQANRFYSSSINLTKIFTKTKLINWKGLFWEKYLLKEIYLNKQAKQYWSL